MFSSVVSFFDRILRKYTPDPFLFAVILTLVVFAMGVLLTPSTPAQMVTHWGDGFWKLNAFTFQMALVLVSGHAVASAPWVQRGLSSVAGWAKTPGQALIATTLIATVGCWLNWGFGLVLGALICREFARTVPRVNYRLLVASAYTGFLVWHGGLSASVPLLMATPGNFTEQVAGRIIPVSETLFSPLNIALVVCMLVLLPLLNWAMGRGSVETATAGFPQEERRTLAPPTVSMSFADRLENSRLLSWALFSMGLMYLLILGRAHKLSMDLDRINFIFLFGAILLHSTPARFLAAMTEAAKKTGPILLQFPFYAGIMGMMGSSGLTEVLSNAFVAVSSRETFPLWTFFSAALVNLFVPSGGGQWAVQGPIVLKAAQSLGADIPKAAMAVAWGGTWTDLLQPFWALPLLAIAGLKLRDVMGYLVTVVLVTGVVFAIAFSIL